MSAADPLLVETVERLLADVSTFDEVEHAEAVGLVGHACGRRSPRPGSRGSASPRPQGGSGGTLYDLAAILRAVGRFAAPVPIAETGMVGGWLLAEAGLALPPARSAWSSSTPDLHDGRLQVDGIGAWARHAERIVVAAGPAVCSLRPDQVQLHPGANLAGEARDRVVADLALDDVEHAVVEHLDPWQRSPRTAVPCHA